MKGSITTTIRGAISDSDNSKLYLAHIEEQFQGSSKAHATTLITKMVTLKYSGSNGVREHILRMNDMASQLKGLDMEISEGFLVHFIMTSLPAQFGPFKINYNTQKEKWKMSELISMCVQEEERLKSEQPDSAHVAITGPSKGKGKKFGKGNVQGNKSASVTKTDKASSFGTKGSSGPRCHFCKDKGHMRKECHKFREWLEKKGNLSICVCYDSYTIDAPLNTWWVDTGATVHITNSLQGFLSMKKLNKGDRNVLVGNGEKAQVEAVGTLRLVLESGFNLDLVDTVYVPSMTRNLISVSRLDAYGYSFKFENKGFSLFLYSRVIGSGLLEGNLYKLLLNASFTESLKTMNVSDVVAKTCGTPQQNGVAERRNRTLMDMVRSMICQSTLPEFLWVEALKTAVHILNRVPSYPERSKGFRFYCPSHTTRIVETRHAVFFEDAEYSGSCTPRIINLEEIQDHVSIPVIQKVGAPLPHRQNNDALEVVPNDVPPIMDPAPIPANEQPLRSAHLRYSETNTHVGSFLLRDLMQRHLDQSVYKEEEASSKKFLVSNYMDFEMTNDRPISVQVCEFQLIANDICAVGMVLDENFHIGAIVAKLPPTWNEYRNKLKHKKEDLALDQLMQHLHIEEETRNRENEPAKETIVKAHVVVDKDEKKNSRRHNQKKFFEAKEFQRSQAIKLKS
ncbi:hypothetical protein RJ639_021497 [Escallonia herrerae]|uniref:Retrovirus-related Pol polyprotein from transposon TNT 1-94-like beta-barrel domain-containing protein n=1 Tax=Escallonia herrerae TaxID=1293975 RepID=A0AA89AHE4_9ASTE|nr:hypothetical protein RJ639_021497 [Escallonia herrerae]